MKHNTDIGGFPLFLTQPLCFMRTGFLLVLFLTLCLNAVLPVQAMTETYSIQIGAYQDLTNAVKSTSRMGRTGQPVFLRHETTKEKGTWYKAYVGRFGSKRSAEKKAKELKQAGLISNYYIKSFLVERGAGVVSKAKYTPGAYYLHLSSFVQKSQAEMEIGRLKKFGYEPYLATTELSGQTWFRVCVGAFANKSEARKAGMKMKKKGLISFFQPRRVEGVKTAVRKLEGKKPSYRREKRERKKASPRGEAKRIEALPSKAGEKASAPRSQGKNREEEKDREVERKSGAQRPIATRKAESAKGSGMKSRPDKMKSSSLKGEDGDGVTIMERFRPGLGNPIGSVLLVQGKVVIMHSDKSRGYWAKKSLPLFKGDTINALERGRVRFKLNDGSIMIMGSKTKMVLNRSIYNQREKRRASFLGLRAGKVRFWVKKIFGFRHSEFKVKTPTAIVGMRGSDFVIRVTPRVTEVTTFEDTRLEVVSLAAPEAAPTLLEGLERTVVRENALPTEVERVRPEEAEAMKRELSFTPETADQEGKPKKEEKEEKKKEDKGGKDDKKEKKSDTRGDKKEKKVKRAGLEKGATEDAGTGEGKGEEGERESRAEGGTTDESEPVTDGEGEGGESGQTGEGESGEEGTTGEGEVTETTTAAEGPSGEGTGEEPSAGEGEIPSGEAGGEEAPVEEATTEDATGGEGPSGEHTTMEESGMGDALAGEPPPGPMGMEGPIGPEGDMGVLVSEEELVAPEEPIGMESFEGPFVDDMVFTEEIATQVESVLEQQEVTTQEQTQTTTTTPEPPPELPPFPGTPP